MYKFRNHISWQKLDGRLFLFDERTGNMFSLDGIACEMCLPLASGEAINDVVNTISSKYSVDPQMVKDDLENFCHELIESEVLEVSHNG